jgi:transcription elongation factor Elf1
MNKTFKKAIAVILSVLMVVLSVPFTALAAPGDYAPNAKLSFGMFTEASATSFTDYSTSGTAASDFGSYASLYGVPVDYNYKVVDGNKTSGTLSINKDKANTYIDAAGLSYDKLSQDTQLGVGDYFTMTLSLEGMSNLCAFVAQIQFSDSIEPAGVYSYKSGRKMVYALGTENERVAASGTWVADKGGTTFLPTYSLCSTGIDKNSFNPEFDPNSSKVKANDEDGKMNVISYEFGSAGSSTASLSDPDGYFVNPETGEPGYTFTNNPPMATFVFKIVTADPIEFNVYHPSELNSIALAADTSEVQSQYKTTYAKNAWNDKTNTNDGDVEHPGSKKFTFMGFNEFREAPKPSTYTIKFKYANGGEEVSKTVNAGEMPTAPETNTPQTVESDNAGNHTVTTYTWPTVEAATADRVYDEVANPVKSECHYIEKVTVKPTYTTKGEATYTCDVCGHSYTAEIDKLVCDHADTKVVNATKPTINNAGYTGDTVCNVCGETIVTGTEIAQLKGEAYRAALKAAKDVDGSKFTADSYAKVTKALADYDETTVGAYTSQEDVDAATAALKAAVKDLVANPTTETYTYNFINGESKERTVNKGETPENYPNTPAKVTDNKDGTHTTTTYTWSQDGFVFTEVGNDTQDSCTLNYETVTQPTIKVEGSKTATCPVCGHVSTLPIDKLNGTEYYNALDAAQNVKADDFTAASYAKVAEALKANAQATVEAYTTQEDVDAATAALKDAVAKLDAGVVVTVASTKLGTTTLNGVDATNGANARLAVGDDVVLTAKANNETGEFVGWKVGNKIVSDEATFKTAAAADITYEAVFAEKVDETFTVVFVDPYGNVISTQPVTNGSAITIPDAPKITGYTFTGWSMTPEEISKLTDGATIYAQYKKDDVAKYTVTVPEDATLTVDGVETASPAQVAYDAKVSVHKDGAEAWKLADGTVVGYGDTYTFFCGSDMSLEAEMTAVKKETTVVITGVNEIADSVQVSFAATRNVAPGETVVQQGFVYGKNLADSELTLENVGNKGAAANAGTVKILYTKNSAQDIALRYGLAKKDGKVSARAFVITKASDGSLKTTMSNIESYTYA